MRILAVDDDELILELVPLMAATAGFPDVVTAVSADHALKALTNSDVVFDCLLLDINMPQMDGIELCRRVRELERYRSTPIIMLTAMSERVHMDEAFRAGATDYATKPFDVLELGARLRVAKELVLARRAADITRESVDTASTFTAYVHPFEFLDEIPIHGVKNLISFDSLKNYLRQSSRAGLASSQMTAVKIDQCKDIYRRAQTEELYYALHTVASVVNQVVQRYGGMISYVGSGNFVVVSNSPVQATSEELESEVQNLLDEMNTEYDDGTPMDIEVSIGSPIQPYLGNFGEITKTLERAIARAESRSERKLTQTNLLVARRFLS